MSTPLALKTLAAPAIIAAGLIVAPVAAHAAASLGDVVGTTEAEIRTALERQGYEVEEIETEDGAFEVEVEMNGEEIEIEIEAASGRITAMETDD